MSQELRRRHRATAAFDARATMRFVREDGDGATVVYERDDDVGDTGRFVRQPASGPVSAPASGPVSAPASGPVSAPAKPAPVKPAAAPRPVVIVADRDAETAGWVARRLADLADVHAVSSAAGAVALLRGQVNPVAIVGHQLDDAAGETLIAALVARTPAAVIAVGGDPGATISHPGLYYQIDRRLDPDTVRQVVASALNRRAHPAGDLEDPVALQRLAGAARKVALQRTTADVARAIVDVVPALVDADRAALLFFDDASGSLWGDAEPGAAPVDHPARGLAGFAARTAAPVCVDRAGADPRFCADVDGPRCVGDDRLAIVPLVDADGEVHAVIQVVRSARAAVFGPTERALLAAFAARVTPVLDALALEARADALAPRAAPGEFRPEALAAHLAPREEGSALQIAPRWTRAAYWLLLAFMIAALTYLCLARVDELAVGKAVFLAEGHHAVAFASPGTVGEIAVAPGTRVAAGDPLVWMHDAAQRADLESIERELEQRLVDRLEHPDDEATAAPLTALLARRHRAELAVGERVLRAPVAGVIADVRVRPGQSVDPGDEALTLVEDGAAASQASVIALLPAGQAPLVRPGMSLRLALDGHRGAFVAVVVDSVTRDATGPAVARRLLGAALADSVAIAGPVMLVRGHPLSNDFVVDGHALALRHGMTGRASIRLRSQPMIMALIPGLTEVLGR